MGKIDKIDDSIIAPDFGHQTCNEKIPTRIISDYREVARLVANEIASLIRVKQQKGEIAVLGLATGSTPTNVYRELVRLHKEEGLSFSNVVTFNLDEYYPMKPDSLQSYVRFMHEHLFDHIDIKPENILVAENIAVWRSEFVCARIRSRRRWCRTLGWP